MARPAPRPFRIAVPDADLADLAARLRATRWPDELQGVGWEYGLPLDLAKRLAAHWADGFDWRAAEARLNAWPQFLVDVGTPPPCHEPVTLHCVHLTHAAAVEARGGTVEAGAPPATPLLLLHGWPGSFFEFSKVMGPLTDPAAHGAPPGTPAFDVVAPSLPGYGFSPAPTRPGFGIRATAAAVNALMLALGYDRYMVQGGDWGSIVARALGTHHAAHAAAVHVNMVLARPRLTAPWTLLQAANAPLARWAPLFITKDEAKHLGRLATYAARESGYFRIQATRPQTLAYGLTDSPAGLMAWIVEKFRQWSDCGGDPLSVFSMDDLLTNVCLYWFPQSAASSVRLYAEAEKGGELGPLMSGRCAAPTAALLLPKELFRPPRAWAAVHYNLKRWTVGDRGGHFAALEVPEALVADVRAFARQAGAAAVAG